MEDAKAAKKLNTEDLGKVSGGYIYCSMEDNFEYQVIDEKGNVVSRHKDYLGAYEAAIKSGYSCEVIEWDQLRQIRRDHGIFE